MIDIEKFVIKNCKKCNCDGKFYNLELIDGKMEIKPCKSSHLVNLYSKYENAGITPEWWEFEVEDIEKEFDNKILKDLKIFEENIKSALINKSQFWFFGGVGAGKTTIATLMLKYALKSSLRASMIKSGELINIIYNHKEKLEELRKKDFIIIDEIDKLNGRISVINDFCNEVVNFMDSKAMVFISNFDVVALQSQGYPEYFIDRLENVYCIKFKGQSYRKKFISNFEKIKGEVK